MAGSQYTKIHSKNTHNWFLSWWKYITTWYTRVNIAVVAVVPSPDQLPLLWFLWCVKASWIHPHHDPTHSCMCPRDLGWSTVNQGLVAASGLDPSCSLTVSPALLSLGRLAKLLQNDLGSQEGPAASQDDTNYWWIVMHKVPKISASYPSALHKYVFTLTFMIAVLKCCQTTVLIFGKWAYDSKASLLQQWK